MTGGGYAAGMARCAVFALFALSGCSVWFFSGESWVDRTRPVVLVETTGGVEYGAATEFGVLTLGRSAADGPCRVHYFLGPTPLTEPGTLGPTGGVFTAADIDLKTQAVRSLDRAPTRDDRLFAMWTPDGVAANTIPVRLAAGPGIEGDVLEAPAQPLPAGATILMETREGTVQFVGLVAGRAHLEGAPGAGDYYVFAGVDRIREMLAVPQQYPRDLQPRYRPDDITVWKPVPPAPADPTAKTPAPAEPAPATPAPILTPKR